MGTIKPKKHNCMTCGNETWGRECNLCKGKRYAQKSKLKQKERKPIKKNYRKTGELDLFKEIWEERPHVSEVSGIPLLDFDVRCFSHILPKGTYPLFKFEKRNILLKTPKEHNEWQFSQDTLKTPGNKWEKVFVLKEELTREYYKKFYGKSF